MSRGRWPAPRRVVNQAGFGWRGLWSLLDTAEHAVTALAAVSPLTEQPDLVRLAERLRRASTDVFVDYPGPAAAAIAFDLGPIAYPSHAPAARDMAIRVLSAVLRECNEMLGYELDIEDNALLSRVTTAAWDVREDLTGGGTTDATKD